MQEGRLLLCSKPHCSSFPHTKLSLGHRRDTEGLLGIIKSLISNGTKLPSDLVDAVTACRLVNLIVLYIIML